MKERIDTGDIVAVNFNGAPFTFSKRAKVLHIPCATGDSWIFKDEETGNVAYISEGCTILKLEDGPGFQL